MIYQWRDRKYQRDFQAHPSMDVAIAITKNDSKQIKTQKPKNEAK